MNMIRRHRAFRAMEHSRNRSRYGQGNSVDVERGGGGGSGAGAPATSRVSLDGYDDGTDWDASDGMADADDRGSLINSRFMLKPYRKSLVPGPRIAESMDPGNHLQRPSFAPLCRTDWKNCNARTYGHTLPCVAVSVEPEESRRSSEEQSWWTRLRQWLRTKHIGLTARQQLTMKLYCEQFTTVSYPAGKIMVSSHLTTYQCKVECGGW
ncbi:unnamed protein product [Echinostoma caproni]|uniref:ARID domain-containing protein n=1 Tax=Echinostoma caproni TaxID=27848 RepID=A0A183BFQ9_9TREM|nr:unnamed protein product [Echinostoma caproni]